MIIIWDIYHFIAATVTCPHDTDVEPEFIGSIFSEPDTEADDDQAVTEDTDHKSDQEEIGRLCSTLLYIKSLSKGSNEITNWVTTLDYFIQNIYVQMRICANLVVRSLKMVRRVIGSDVTGTVAVGSTTGVLVLQENPDEAQSLYVVSVTNYNN